jgi:two-component system cell cycle response regulator DivK
METRNPRFVYIEDDMLSQEVVRVLLQTVLGYPNLTVFPDSANLLERLGELGDTPDVFFLDVQIGPHDGFEMIDMLRRSEPYQSATIVAMTANVMAHDIEALKQAGFDGLIGKPIRKKVFPALVQNLIAGEAVWYVP